MTVWWPGVVLKTIQMVQSCSECAKEAESSKHPLDYDTPPRVPKAIGVTDLFELDKSQYLLAIDYFSRYLEVIQLKSTTSASVIAALKRIFAGHGIPETVTTGPNSRHKSLPFCEIVFIDIVY